MPPLHKILLYMILSIVVFITLIFSAAFAPGYTLWP